MEVSRVLYFIDQRETKRDIKLFRYTIDQSRNCSITQYNKYVVIHILRCTHQELFFYIYKYLYISFKAMVKDYLECICVQWCDSHTPLYSSTVYEPQLCTRISDKKAMNHKSKHTLHGQPTHFLPHTRIFCVHFSTTCIYCYVYILYIKVYKNFP